eukprot:242840-Alexandrium_andersonii.AAC.1
MRTCLQESGASNLGSASITADNPNETIARGKYVLSQFGPLPGDFIKNDELQGGADLSVAMRDSPK